jgi:dTDP-4-dehydrorhamnose 3,5-epimerase
MGDVTVNEILVTPLKHIPLAEGDVLHGMKCNDPGYVDFGEVYFSVVYKGAIKAWKRHMRMTLNLVVPQGTIQFVFMDGSGTFREEVVGRDRYVRLTVPPRLWFAFRGLDESHSLLMNVADIPHDPNELERATIAEISFDWEKIL